MPLTPVMPVKGLRYLVLALSFVLLMSITYISTDTFSTTLKSYHETYKSYRFSSQPNIKQVTSFLDSLVIYPKTENLKYEQTDFVVQYAGDSSGLSTTIVEDEYKNHTLSIFMSEIQSDDCKAINVKENIGINNYLTLPDNLAEMAQILQDQLDNEDAFKHIAPFFENKIPNMIAARNVSKHFFKFVGTSVWLKEYGVHLMVSRVLFSRRGIKWDPQISLMYAQVYNEDWQELHNVKLKIPNRNGGGPQTMKFPSFLRVPFNYDSSRTARRWYGPEDGRILLIQNEYGVEEPVLIFNSHTRMLETTGGETEEVFYRSIFMGWVFQEQIGKANVDGEEDIRFDNTRYIKVRQLQIIGEERNQIEKNWTPFVDVSERDKFDRNLYIVYDWHNLQILKCDLYNLTSDRFSNCERVYNAGTPHSKIGVIRGGTELIPLSSVRETGNQLWIGFVRTHINRCGCGSSMYRPHLVILQRAGHNYRVTHMSSSISFDIPGLGAGRTAGLCGKRDPNILIANGISNWELDENTGSDYLTLTLSTGDEYNTLVHIKDLGKMIERLDLDVAYEEENTSMRGCVVSAAFDFCKAFGIEMDELGLTQAAMDRAEKEKQAKEKEAKQKEAKEKEAKEKPKTPKYT
ncbi:uncharacterized protein SPAPADRAFT_63670 [Spathaspora passalidarum NRRL Y-27907]|uniref:Uncharacterized protein n=1 Tax=Spathaspora passalidarum (strain NRRL Y-27907 / 11-Y1) TaxID=619300 RepID=G3AUW3_SPAPN|nr:uncharacterized protein SPAPADRAFT_63670 [Spathaspora passalidarum NRRL Y-27907]EGW30054.1 hypothetical protein SPAPADRAFT_63670 [Spathaspora passalidarum NRRL Y-27907]